MNRHRPENDPRLPRHLSDAVALYAIMLVVAAVALMPMGPPDDAAEALTIAARAPVAAHVDDAGAER